MTKEQLEALLDVYGTNVAVAKEVGVSEWTIRNWRKQLGIPSSPPMLTVQKIDSAMKILAIDIETRPNLGYVWDLWNQNIGLSQLEESVHMMCFAAKWIGAEDVTRFWSEHLHGRKEMVSYAWKLMDEADVIVHYNGKKFDVPHLQREFVQFGHGPTSPFKQIDLLKVVKDNFKFPSNKLQYVAPALGLEDKVSHEGFELWLACMDGDDAAWGRMQEYNIQDVELLEQLYFKLRPWIKGHPSYGAMRGEDVCPTCGSFDLQKRGVQALQSGRYQRFHCGHCGRWSRSSKREAGTTVVGIA